MLYKRICILLCALITCLTVTLCTQVFAVLSDEHTSSLTAEEQRSFWEGISLHVVEKEPQIEPISCFDVNADGQVALGFQASSINRISIYSNNGEFQYAYEFKCYGNFYVYWEQNNVCIYFVRSRMVVTVDQNGRYVDICHAKNSAADSNYLKVIKSPNKQVDGVQYYLENDMVIGRKFGRLCVMTPDGPEYVFYDATELHNSRIITTIIAVVLFTFIVMFCVIKRLPRNAKMN